MSSFFRDTQNQCNTHNTIYFIDGHNNDTTMQQQKQQLNSKTERADLKSSEDSNSNVDGMQKEHRTIAENMNVNDNATYSNSVPYEQHEQYAGAAGWPLSPGATKPSPVTAKLYSGYTFGDAHMHDVGSSSLTREEQANDDSYKILASKRDSKSTALEDGRIEEPHLNDVLCGRGGSINSHPGNRVFRGWVAERKESYNLAESKADKTRITAELLEKVRGTSPPGRFLHKLVERDNDPYTYKISGWWSEIDDLKALAKISQALREGAPAFRALHAKKGRKKKKKQQSAPPQRKSTRHKHKKKETRAVSREKWKAPPRMEAATSSTRQELASIPDLPMVSHEHDHHEHELDVLFPTTNNFFATESRGNGNLLNSYPLVHMGDYTASMDEVAAAVPPTPPTTKKPRPSVLTEAKPTGKCTPNLQPSPNTPLVSPGFSPYGEAKAAWDAISFLPNLSPTPGNSNVPLQQKPSLRRGHSLSFSDGDVHSVGSFSNPFENDNHIHHEQGKLEVEVPDPSPSFDPNAVSTRFPAHLPQTPPHGLSFGKIGNVPGADTYHPVNSRHKLSHRSSNASSKGSISNYNNSTKRKSIG